MNDIENNKSGVKKHLTRWDMRNYQIWELERVINLDEHTHVTKGFAEFLLNKRKLELKSIVENRGKEQKASSDRLKLAIKSYCAS